MMWSIFDALICHLYIFFSEVSLKVFGPLLFFFFLTALPVSLLFFLILFFNFTILYWFCHISTWIHHRYTCVPHPKPSSLLPPHTILLGRPSAPAPSIQYHASNQDWRLVSYMILYMFQCHSPKSSHPLPLPQSPKDCSIHWPIFKLGYLSFFILKNLLNILDNSPLSTVSFATISPNLWLVFSFSWCNLSQSRSFLF